MSLPNKITMQQFEDFEKKCLFNVIANPHYRLGQAFSNRFPYIIDIMESGGDISYSDAMRLWNSTNRTEILKLIEWYIE
jgi:hypothetical protein